jgi:hypothetical protein
MPRYEIIIYWSQLDEAFFAEVPELPGCAADGKTYKEALAQRRDHHCLLAERPCWRSSDATLADNGENAWKHQNCCEVRSCPKAQVRAPRVTKTRSRGAPFEKSNTKWCASQFESLTQPARKGVNSTSVLKVCIIGHEQP